MDSYKDTIFEPLEYYRDVGKAEHKRNTEEYFESLLSQSKVNVEENRATVKKYKEHMAIVDKLDKELGKLKAIRIASVVITAVVTVIMLIVAFLNDEWTLPTRVLSVVLPLVIGIIASIAVFRSTGDKIKHLAEKKKEEADKAKKYLDEAQRQMAPLNALFSDLDSKRILEKTMPQIVFDDQFTTVNLEDMRNNYDFNGVLDEKSSVTDMLSGRMYGNPFLVERFVTETTVMHTYVGTLYITWTTYERDSEGKMRTVHHSQTLTASIVRPRPNYESRTLTNYGHQAAPDLCFSRENKHFEDLSEGQVERKVKSGEKKLRKKAEKALKNGGSFTEMANTKFDVLFGATDRNNEQQFRMLFTPLAQREMIDLIRSEEGYGDDFDIFKTGKLNVIRSEHAQRMDLSIPAFRFHSYDVDECRANFITINEEFFKALYFELAPLIAIPAYQEKPMRSFEDIEQKDLSYTSYNYEMIANRLPRAIFAPHDSTTDSILKTTFVSRDSFFDTVNVKASSYVGVPRLELVPTLGNDGRIHAVPVHWTEYIPCERHTLMKVRNVGITESEYTKRASAEDREELLKSCACYGGVFACVDDGTYNVNEFINNIIRKGEQ